MNKVIWIDVVLFEDNSFVLEACYIDVVETFKKRFNRATFTSVEQLNKFFGNSQYIYDCEQFIAYIKNKYKKPFKLLFLDNIELSLDMEIKIKEKIDISKCGGYINKIQF